MAANNEDKDMKPWLLAPLLFFTTAICHPQSISINHPNRYSPYWPHYTVGAANDDPRARTLEEIFAVNQTLARKGNTEAAFELALAYLQGYGTTQDLAQADHWFRIGATTPDEKSISPGCTVTGPTSPRTSTPQLSGIPPRAGPATSSSLPRVIA